MRRYESHPCTANMLDDLLNDMAAQGMRPIQIIPAGMRRMENRLMPGQETIMPLLIVVFEKEQIIDA